MSTEIYKKINEIMKEVDPIAKDQQGYQYKYRGNENGKKT